MADLLANIQAEIDARLRELRPAMVEYERLSTAAGALVEEHRPAASKPAMRTAPGLGGRAVSQPARRTVSAPVGRTASRPVRAPARAGANRTTAAKRTTGAKSATGAKAMTGARRTTAAKGARGVRRREQPAHTPVGQAILAALEHGSHTLAELVTVTALSASDIREALRRLRGRGAIVKTDRDGKAAYALPS